MTAGIASRVAMLALTGSLVMSSPLAVASGDAVVAARQASMKAMAAAAKTVAEMFDGKRAYDAADFRTAADTLRTRTGPVLIAEFPSGTLGAPSGAKAEIDQARPEFEALARKGRNGAGANHQRHAHGRDAADGWRQPARQTAERRACRSWQAAGGASPASHPAGLFELPFEVPAEGEVTQATYRFNST
ncbi:cytochrome c [Mesorhizobium sp.]|uniref:cytochrome c n=1 Tax=Mesorhizobium sp. TaxID=1871066 RepID=UPI0025BC61A8|nr:cytochrome c [Mesorhizobium sp.]